MLPCVQKKIHTIKNKFCNSYLLFCQMQVRGFPAASAGFAQHKRICSAEYICVLWTKAAVKSNETCLGAARNSSDSLSIWFWIQFRSLYIHWAFSVHNLSWTVRSATLPYVGIGQSWGPVSEEWERKCAEMWAASEQSIISARKHYGTGKTDARRTGREAS